MDEEKWLADHLLPKPAGLGIHIANTVIFLAAGAKYPARLGAFYRAVLREGLKLGGWEHEELAKHVAASKLPRAERLTLLVEGAGHERLAFRNAALAPLDELDEPTFRKHLFATLKTLPPDVEPLGIEYPVAKLANLLWKTGDPACWDALVSVARRSEVDVRIAIVRQFYATESPEEGKQARPEVLRFLLQFLSDDSSDGSPPGEAGTPILNSPPNRVQNVAAEVLADQLSIDAEIARTRGPVSCLFARAAVARAAVAELARLKK